MDKWKDAILNECNSVFVSNKEYKAFIYLMIKDEKQKQKDFSEIGIEIISIIFLLNLKQIQYLDL